MTVETLPLSSIEVDPTVNIRDKLDEGTIQWYMESFEQLPPVIAYRLNGKLLLADGFHRWSAAERLGLGELRVEVREGTAEEAQEFAVMANWRHGKNLSQFERDKAVARMATMLHPAETNEQIGKRMDLSERSVRRALRAIDMYKFSATSPHSQNRLSVIAGAPNESQKRLMEREDLTHPELQAAVRTLNDPNIDAGYKDQMLAGEAPPLTERGGVLLPTIRREIEKARERDGILALWRITEVMAAAKARFEPAEIAAQAEPKDIPQLLRLLPDQRAWLDAVIVSLEAVRE